MKQCRSTAYILLVCLVGFAGPAVSDLASLRGASDIPTTQGAPKLMKFINDKENVERTFKEQPPVVPHTVDRYEINLKVNECLECHVKQAGKDEAKSVEMSESHFVNRKGEKLDRPAGARHFCDQCHVPQIDAKPLVGTNFQAAK